MREELSLNNKALKFLDSKIKLSLWALFLNFSFLHTPGTAGSSQNIYMQKYVIGDFSYGVHLI